MAFVLCSSVALAWLLPGDHPAEADEIAQRLEREPAVVPAVWTLEVGEGLRAAEGRAGLTEDEAARSLEILQSLPVETDSGGPATQLHDTLALARVLSLSAADAAYVELALRRGLPLATLDDRLRHACMAARVPVLP
jgi:predicted nucleic acid-binding protein